MAVVTPLNNFLGPEGDTVTVDKQLLNTEYWTGVSNLIQKLETPKHHPHHTPLRLVNGLQHLCARN
jgi:hypothetical protein